MDGKLDLRGLKCPLPVLKTRNKLRTLEPGARLWVIADDPLAVIDIPAFCNEAGQVLVEQSAGEGDSNRFLIERQDKRP